MEWSKEIKPQTHKSIIRAEDKNTLLFAKPMQSRIKDTT